jgi:hypothetical protein
MNAEKRKAEDEAPEAPPLAKQKTEEEKEVKFYVHLTLVHEDATISCYLVPHELYTAEDGRFAKNVAVHIHFYLFFFHVFFVFLEIQSEQVTE